MDKNLFAIITLISMMYVGVWALVILVEKGLI